MINPGRNGLWPSLYYRDSPKFLTVHTCEFSNRSWNCCLLQQTCILMDCKDTHVIGQNKSSPSTFATMNRTQVTSHGTGCPDIVFQVTSTIPRSQLGRESLIADATAVVLLSPTISSSVQYCWFEISSIETRDPRPATSLTSSVRTLVPP